MLPIVSQDSQGISTKMVKLNANQISHSLAHIFNLSLTSCVFPKKLKMCRVILIFKTGNKLDCDNYRPISLLSSISKILEKIVAKKLIDHLLNMYTNGFMPNRSTEHNLQWAHKV